MSVIISDEDDIPQGGLRFYHSSSPFVSPAARSSLLLDASGEHHCPLLRGQVFPRPPEGQDESDASALSIESSKLQADAQRSNLDFASSPPRASQLSSEDFSGRPSHCVEQEEDIRAREKEQDQSRLRHLFGNLQFSQGERAESSGEKTSQPTVPFFSLLDLNKLLAESLGLGARDSDYSLEQSVDAEACPSWLKSSPCSQLAPLLPRDSEEEMRCLRGQASANESLSQSRLLDSNSEEKDQKTCIFQEEKNTAASLPVSLGVKTRDHCSQSKSRLEGLNVNLSEASASSPQSLSLSASSSSCLACQCCSPFPLLPRFLPLRGPPLPSRPTQSVFREAGTRPLAPNVWRLPRPSIIHPEKNLQQLEAPDENERTGENGENTQRDQARIAKSRGLMDEAARRLQKANSLLPASSYSCPLPELSDLSAVESLQNFAPTKGLTLGLEEGEFTEGELERKSQATSSKASPRSRLQTQNSWPIGRLRPRWRRPFAEAKKLPTQRDLSETRLNALSVQLDGILPSLKSQPLLLSQLSLPEVFLLGRRGDECLRLDDETRMARCNETVERAEASAPCGSLAGLTELPSFKHWDAADAHHADFHPLRLPRLFSAAEEAGPGEKASQEKASQEKASQEKASQEKASQEKAFSPTRKGQSQALPQGYWDWPLMRSLPALSDLRGDRSFSSVLRQLLANDVSSSDNGPQKEMPVAVAEGEEEQANCKDVSSPGPRFQEWALKQQNAFLGGLATLQQQQLARQECLLRRQQTLLESQQLRIRTQLNEIKCLRQVVNAGLYSSVKQSPPPLCLSESGFVASGPSGCPASAKRRDFSSESAKSLSSQIAKVPGHRQRMHLGPGPWRHSLLQAAGIRGLGVGEEDPQSALGETASCEATGKRPCCVSAEPHDRRFSPTARPLLSKALSGEACEELDADLEAQLRMLQRRLWRQPETK